MDTLLFADAERKHSLTAVERKDLSRSATRDMLIFFTRKPIVKGHVSYKYDSLVGHKTLPLRVSLNEMVSADRQARWRQANRCSEKMESEDVVSWLPGEVETSTKEETSL